MICDNVLFWNRTLYSYYLWINVCREERNGIKTSFSTGMFLKTIATCFTIHFIDVHFSQNIYLYDEHEWTRVKVVVKWSDLNMTWLDHPGNFEIWERWIFIKCGIFLINFWNASARSLNIIGVVWKIFPLVRNWTFVVFSSLNNLKYYHQSL